MIFPRGPGLRGIFILGQPYKTRVTKSVTTTHFLAISDSHLCNECHYWLLYHI